MLWDRLIPVVSNGEDTRLDASSPPCGEATLGFDSCQRMVSGATMLSLESVSRRGSGTCLKCREDQSHYGVGDRQ